MIGRADMGFGIKYRFPLGDVVPAHTSWKQARIHPAELAEPLPFTGLNLTTLLPRYVIMQVLLEAGQNFLKVEQVEGKDGQPDLLITMDRSKVI
jgi:hypothetical protein